MIRKADNGQVIVESVRIADTFWSRFRGLMLDDSLKPTEALVILPCQSIHCFFMRMPIDVMFLNRSGEVVHLIREMRPWSFSPHIRAADYVVECFPGTISRYDVKVGDNLAVDEVPSQLSKKGAAI